MSETGKVMWERRNKRIERLRSMGYCSGVLSYMTDEEVKRAYEYEKQKRKKETEK